MRKLEFKTAVFKPAAGNLIAIKFGTNDEAAFAAKRSSEGANVAVK